MNEIRAIIFDLDGTLADTIPLIIAGWNAAVTPYTQHSYSDAEVIARFGIPDNAMIRRELPGRQAEHAIQVYYDFYEQNHDHVKPFAGVEALLEDLRRKSIQLGLMTGKDRPTADITLRKLGWEDLFSSVITGDEIDNQKPNPEGPLKVAKALRVDPQYCAFVGDSPADIGAGKAAKMFTIAAAWASVYVDKLRSLDPDAWANHPTDVIRLIAER